METPNTPQTCSSINLQGETCKAMAKKGSLFCRHHQVVEDAEAPAIEHDNSQYEAMNQLELYNFAFNRSKGHIKLDIKAPLHVMIEQLNTFNLNDF